jgi:hypothetical protein
LIKASAGPLVTSTGIFPEVADEHALFHVFAAALRADALTVFDASRILEKPTAFCAAESMGTQSEARAIGVDDTGIPTARSTWNHNFLLMVYSSRFRGLR